MIKKIVAFIALAVYMQTALYAQENQNRTLINAALHGWEYEIRAGVSIGGTSPLPLPVEIRSIDTYNPTLALMLEGNAIKWLGKTKKWGVITGVRLETKNMITKATVKNYGMEIIGNDGNRLKGNWTGGVKTKVRNAYITVPVLGAYKINSRLRAKAGAYVSYRMRNSPDMYMKVICVKVILPERKSTSPTVPLPLTTFRMICASLPGACKLV